MNAYYIHILFDRSNHVKRGLIDHFANITSALAVGELLGEGRNA